MKRKINKKSLIFPIISFVGALILLLVMSEVNVRSDQMPMLIAFVVCGILPLLSVLFLKTDISGFLKRQIIFTVLSVISEGWYVFMILSIILFWVGLFVFGIVVPFVLTAACVISYIIAARREPDRKVLKFFTALLSSPAVYLSIYFIADCITFCTEGLSGLAYIG